MLNIKVCPSDHVFEVIASGTNELSQINDMDIEKLVQHLNICPSCSAKARVLAQIQKFDLNIAA